MNHDSSLNPFTGIRGTKPWILDRIVNPPSRHYLQIKAPPFFPRFFSRWVIVRMIPLLLVACMLLFLWQSNPLGVGLATGTADASRSTLSTPSAPQTRIEPTPSRSPSTPTVAARATTPTTSPPKPTVAPITNGTKYVVKSGDSLWLIATQYKVTVDELRAANNLTSNLLHVGDQLVIPIKSQ